MTLATCMMAMGKLWMDAANTAEASDRSFLSRNSAASEPAVFSTNETKRCNRRALVLQMSGALTLQHKLLHLDLVELVGADDDAVAGQVDAAAGLQGFDLL